MADLVIGGNTYQNIEYVKIKRADGKIATFFDSRNKNKMQLSASVSYIQGLARRMSASVNLGNPTVSVSHTQGETWSLSASVNLGTITANLTKVEE